MVSWDDIRELSVAERVQLVEDIWDTIPASAEDFPVSEAQRAELDRRLEHLESDPQGRPWREVLERIQSAE